MAEFIQRFAAKNYACLKDVSVGLTPLHAFIGPNDSGKSTLLRAIRTAVQFAGRGFSLDAERDGIRPFDPGIDDNPLSGLRLHLEWGDFSYDLAGDFDGPDFLLHEVAIQSGAAALEGRRDWPPSGPKTQFGKLRGAEDERYLAARRHFRRGTRLLRLNADALREPSSLIARNALVHLEDEHGRGLAGVYDVILNQHLDGYVAIREEVRRLFPSVKTFGLENVSDSTKELRIQLLSGEWIPARFMSEGLLYYLAFAAIAYLDRTALLLVEEPENGLHPSRIADVMRILREASKTTQILVATHSPLVINEMQPEEVSVVTRSPEAGTKVTPMKETANFEKRSSVYALGELWLSFADGVEEAPLLRGRGGS